MLRSFCLLIAVVLSAPVVAAGDPARCFQVASVADAVALERDAGTPQSDAATEVKAFALMLHDAVLDDKALDMLITSVYDAPEVTRKQVYSRVLEQCTALTVY